MAPAWFNLFKPVKLEDICPDDLVIVLLGVTGSGKSEFIEKAAANPYLHLTGHESTPRTKEITVVKLAIPELLSSNICFVETPGFDINEGGIGLDDNIDKVVQGLSKWLKGSCAQGMRPKALLYFHRISDNRMDGTPSTCLRHFQNLLNDGDFRNVVLTTTHWDDVEEDLGNSREVELKKDYWNLLMAKGSRVERFMRTRSSAFQVLQPIIDEANERHTELLREEVSAMAQKLHKAHGGKVLHGDLERLLEQHQSLLRSIRNEFQRPSRPASDMQLSNLIGQHAAVAADLQAKWRKAEEILKSEKLGKRLKMTANTYTKFEWNGIV